MIKINEELKKEIQEKEIYKSVFDIFEVYNSIKRKEYNNYQGFLDLFCSLILYLEMSKNFIPEFLFDIDYNNFIDIICDNLNHILDNMDENWDLDNDTINRRIEFLFNQLKE